MHGFFSLEQHQFPQQQVLKYNLTILGQFQEIQELGDARKVWEWTAGSHHEMSNKIELVMLDMGDLTQHFLDNGY